MLHLALILTLALTSTNVTEADASYDLRTVSTLTAEALQEHMHPETTHLAEEVLTLCAENEISAEFIVTVMRWERRTDLHNYFGWMNDDGTLKRFNTDAECLEYVIPRIKDLYLTEGGKYCSGYTVADVSVYYNSSTVWNETISKEMLHILNTERSATYYESYD